MLPNHWACRWWWQGHTCSWSSVQSGSSGRGGSRPRPQNISEQSKEEAKYSRRRSQHDSVTNNMGESTVQIQESRLLDPFFLKKTKRARAWCPVRPEPDTSSTGSTSWLACRSPRSRTGSPLWLARAFRRTPRVWSAVQSTARRPDGQEERQRTTLSPACSYTD